LVSRTGTEPTEREIGIAPVLVAGKSKSTCQTPEIDPGEAVAETIVPPVWLTIVTGRFKGTPGFEFTEPVVGEGAVTPRPSRKILTGDPTAAGLVQPLRVPSGFNARGSGPPE
jgi:hypothetical protein